MFITQCENQRLKILFLMSAMDLGYQIKCCLNIPSLSNRVSYFKMSWQSMYSSSLLIKKTTFSFWNSRNWAISESSSESFSNWVALISTLFSFCYFLFMWFESKMLFFQRGKQINCHNAQSSLYFKHVKTDLGKMISFIIRITRLNCIYIQTKE